MDLKQHIRSFPDFPKPGILFRDISPILKTPGVMAHIAEQFHSHFKDQKIDLIAGIESRGLAFAAMLADKFDIGSIMIRKQGKLPGPTKQMSYAIEYGSDIMEVQQDAIAPEQRVIIIDDLLATGGTAKAAAELVESLGGVVAGFAFIIELTSLNGRQAISNYEIKTLVSYND